jgi:hypothetical protein
MVTRSCRIPEGFWDSFLSTYWERQPLRLPQLAETGLVSADELFRAVVEKPRRSRWDRCWVAERESGDDVTSYRMLPFDLVAPNASDGSFEGFFARLNTQLGSRPFGVNVQALQTADAGMWFRCREFTVPINRHIGLPARRWDIDTFIGTYCVTPFGIHIDDASVFAIGVVGRRTYYVWPNDFFREGNDALRTADFRRVEPHLRHAIRMELGPGDAVYWPSSYWHVVTSDGRPSVVLQISAYFGLRSSEFIPALLADVLSSRDEDRPMHVFGSGSPNAVAPELIEAEGLLRSVVTDGHVSRKLRELWLQRVTADGFTEVPPRDASAQLHTSDCISLSPCCSLAWMPTADGRLLIACNGLLLEVSHHPIALQLLERLQEGERVTLDDLVEHVTEQDALVIEHLLRELHRCRAFQHVNS